MKTKPQLNVILPDHEVLDVTPQMALCWLQENPLPNRIVAQYRVNMYAREMGTGRWVFNGEPIRFNTKGQLLDGQHRLWAIVESEQTITLSIQRNLADDSIFVTDVGKARNLSQLLSIMGETETGKLSTAITSHHRYIATSTYNSLGANLRPTEQELLAIFKLHGEALKKQLIQARRVKRNGSHGLWASILVVLSGVDATDAADFIAKFESLDMLPSDSPILSLRRRIESSRTSKGIMPKEEQAPLILKAWNLYRRGASVQVLSFKGGGATPEIYPTPI